VTKHKGRGYKVDCEGLVTDRNSDLNDVISLSADYTLKKQYWKKDGPKKISLIRESPVRSRSKKKSPKKRRMKSRRTKSRRTKSRRTKSRRTKSRR